MHLLAADSMSLCINPHCPQPDHPANDGSQFCHGCGSDLILLGRYRVMRLLSDKSGFGLMYEAFDRSTPKVLKVLKESYSHHAKAVELFRQEALVLGQLPHPGIPAIEPQSYFEFRPKHRNQSSSQSSEILHCLIMEKIDGPNLKEWMQQQGYHPISEKQALNWLKQLTEILHLVHHKHYFHRDIKPENVMLRSNGQLVLVDFGAAREMTYSYLEQVGYSGGTRISSAGYTPPEQEKGHAVPQSDFYALGYTLIYLITGKSPTDGAIYDSLDNQLHWRQAAPHISPAFADLIDQLIAPKASQRPPSTTAILQQLMQISQADLANSALPPTLIPASLAAASPQAKQDQVRQPHANRRTHSRISQADSQANARPPQTDSAAQTQAPFMVRLAERLAQPWLWGGAIALMLATGYAVWQFKPSGFLAGFRVTNESATLLHNIEGHGGTVKSLAFTPDGQRLITGDDHAVKVWDSDTGQPLLNLLGHTSTVRSLAVKSDGSLVASASDDQTIKLWNLATGQELRTFKGHTSYINSIVISPDGQMIASASADQTIKLWNLATGEELRTLKGHTSYVNAIVFSPDGRLLASASADQTVRLWEVATGTLLQTLLGHTSYVNAVVFSPDGADLISASADRTIKIWNMTTGAELRSLKGHSSFVEAMAISPDGQRLISGSADQTLKIWDLASGECHHTLTGFDTHIRYLTPSPNWQSVAVAADKSVRIVELPR
jgi:serine/threonine protein kinase